MDVRGKWQDEQHYAKFGGSVHSDAEAVVVPLVQLETEPGTEAMLRMLLNREAVLLTRSPAALSSVPSGLVAHSTGVFSKAISQVTSQMVKSGSSEVLYRAVLPTGSVAKDLIPAVGGGYRGIVRAAGSSAIGGHVRLIPAVAGAGATIAAGPLIATVGLAVAGEMLATHQMRKKLDAIHSALSGIEGHLDGQERAVLTTADQEARRVAGYLLDQANMPHIAHTNHAFGELAQLTNKYVDRLDKWTEVVSRRQNDAHINGARLLTELVGKRGEQIQHFERAVAQTYETLALRARIVVLEKIAAEFSNPGRSLPHVEYALGSELDVLADRQSQLVALVRDLSALSIDGGRLPNPRAIGRAFSSRTSFGRLSRALHFAPDALPMLTESEQTVLELAPTADGLSIVAPASP